MPELSFYYDRIVAKFASWKAIEADRATEVGEQREEIGALLELTGLNKKAFAFVRSIDKMQPDKRQDVLRSLTPLLDMFDRHWNGNSTADMLDGADDDTVSFDDAPNGNAPSYAADLDIEDDDVGDPDIQEEADDFDAALAEAAE